MFVVVLEEVGLVEGDAQMSYFHNIIIMLQRFDIILKIIARLIKIMSIAINDRL